MSVLLETTAGVLVIDLDVDACPRSAENFLALCRLKAYHYSPVHRVDPGFACHWGSVPQYAPGAVGHCVWGLLDAAATSHTAAGHAAAGHAGRIPDVDRAALQAVLRAPPAASTFFEPEIAAGLTFAQRGTVAWTTTRTAADVPAASSQFFITLADGLRHLDGKQAAFGRVVEGWDVLDAIGAAVCDAKEQRPYVDIRITHAFVLHDPFRARTSSPPPPSPTLPTCPGTTGLRWTDDWPASPEPSPAMLRHVRLAPGDDDAEDDAAKSGRPEADAEADAAATPEQAAARQRALEAEAHALTLEMVGDLPSADVVPPENVLFVCQLNAATVSADLALIFSRFGHVAHCDVVRDRATQRSLGYAFIGFADRAAAEAAYLKMDGALVDDRRIRVDFSQSVSRLRDAAERPGHGARARFGGSDRLQRRGAYRADARDDAAAAAAPSRAEPSSERSSRHAHRSSR
ncbi:hypothetical protein CXG81DRAFT_24942 [Caulochytrium protostelioides]|uniref:Peptidyl-prolyl cis-trans isomerase n=1 Tax=Caulochytrium protostelioides TaxID=1555241 RepID=A0A4P9XAK9_9FUNG|nr:hypothetical protein CXG81DRAFT_24942 [Caulochytrium protostelioides]|eukprot:RKP02398.1 hypothetical protein CXG81DRAFT_24942 [Caulochytrium protostelioides]